MTETKSKDDAVLLKARADEFRAGYANWRAHGLKGAKGEVTNLKPVGNASAVTGEAGYRGGYQNWRQGRASGASHISDGALARNDMTEGQAVDAALSGQNWIKFFLQPMSETPARLDGEAFTSSMLCAKNLPTIAWSRKLKSKFTTTSTEVPAYARSLTSFDKVICHIGVGNFHRAHEANYCNDVLHLCASQPELERWCIVGIGLMPWDLRMRDALTKQDCLYSLVSRSPVGSYTKVVGSIADYFYAPDNVNAAIDRVAHPSTRIISLTVTEKGYCLDVNGKLDLTNSLVAHDLETPDVPHSAVGMITAGLRRRRLRGLGGVTVMSCDNLPGNGDLSCLMVMGFLAALGDELLEAWVKANVTFPNTMVDRITPVTKDEHKELVKVTHGIEDDWPVIAEDYTQWVIEEKFSCGRPRWDLVGALMVDNVHPYEMMKLRLLNAGHSAISYISYLAGHRFVDVAMSDPTIEKFCRLYFEEFSMTVPPVPGVDLEDYKEKLIKRFSNPYIKDTLLRLAEDGSQKLVTTMRDSTLENAAAGRPVRIFCLVVAAWLRFLVGVDSEGAAIETKDPRLEELQAMAQAILRPDPAGPICAPTHPPQEFLRTVFGDAIADCQSVLVGVQEWLARLVETSAKEVLAELAAGSDLLQG